jgi:acyl carrier protein
MSRQVHARIRAFIVETFLFGDDSQPLAGDLSLLESDLMDSTGILELVEFLEAEFGVSIADADITPDNLDTIDRIAAFVDAKAAA